MDTAVAAEMPSQLDTQAWRVLDVPAVLAEWEKRCAHDYGRCHVRELTPWVDRDVILERMDWTRAVLERDRAGFTTPAGPLPDIFPLLEVARHPGATLSGVELVRILQVLEAQHLCADYLRTVEDLLQPLASTMVPDRKLLGLLARALDPDGILQGGASTELARLRRQYRQVREGLVRQLQGYLRDPERQPYWQDHTVVQRAGRYLLPIRTDFKNRVRGVVHDRSASGETLFIEPLDAVDTNNLLQEIQLAERQEVERILRELTGIVGQQADRIGVSLALLGRLEAIRAGLELARGWNGEVLELGREPAFDLQELCHPLLQLRHPGSMVSNSIRLGEEYWQILVTGPNAGGKTALLKAVGLAHILGYLGLPVPARGHLGYFCRIYAVIGDSQDIQADLSTFSAQMQWVREILRLASRDTLVLLDEPGNGTDPREGAALAQAVALALRDRRVLALLTSHMEMMRLHAIGEEGVLIAGMGFDTGRMCPSYRLQAGVAAASQGLAIARHLGLPAEVLDRAVRIHDGEKEDWERREEIREQLLRHALAFEASARREAEEAAQLRRRLQEELQRAEQAREQVARESREYWGGLLADAREQVRERIASLKAGRNTQAASEVLAAVDARFEPEQKADVSVFPQPGTRGLFLPLRQAVEVQRVDLAQGRLQILLRGKQIWIPREQFRGDAALELPAETGKSYYVAPGEHPWRLDLRGQRRDQAWMALQRHVDGALAAGRQQVEILHGTGNGVLAAMVRDFARQDPRVLSWRMARPEQGGGGVSELDLR